MRSSLSATISITGQPFSIEPSRSVPLAGALISSGWTKAFLGEPDLAIKHISDAMRISPLDPMSYRTKGALAFAHFIAGRYDNSSIWAERALQEKSNYLPALRDLAASKALAGQDSGSKAAMTRLRELAPAMRVSSVKQWLPFRRPDDLARLEEGLRKAGLPD